MWDCTAYVLDPTLQQGRKLTQWYPQYCHSKCFGLSPNHSSDVTMTPNPYTGHILPQIHVIFDYSFRKALSLSTEEKSTSFWNEFDPDYFLYYVPLNDNAKDYLYAEYLTLS